MSKTGSVPPNPSSFDAITDAIFDCLLEGRDEGEPWGVATPAIVLEYIEEETSIPESEVPKRQTINNRMRNHEHAGNLENWYGKGVYRFVADPRVE